MFSASFFKTGIVPAAVSLATFSSPFFAKAQSDSLKFNNLLFSKTHISLSLNPNYSKSKTKLTSGTQNMTPIYMEGLEGGIDFIFNPNKSIGIKTGLHFGRQPLDWSYTMNQPYDTINNYYAQSSAKDWVLFARQYYSYISIPLLLEWRTPLNRKTYFTAAGGINLGNSLTWFFGVNDGDLDLEMSPPDFSFRTNYATSAGLSFVLKNNNLLFINATANFSHNDLIKGDFAFYSPTGVISTGTYSKGGSSLGLEFGYRFTQEKKAARMVSKPAYKYSKQRARLNTKILRSNLDTIFSHNQIEVNIGKQINLKPTIKTEKGSKPDVTGLPNSMLSAAYTFNINRHWGIKTGLEMGAIIYQYNNLQYFDSASNKNYHGEIYFYEGTYSLNVSVNYHYPICRNILLEANAGLNTTRLFEGGGTYVYGMGREGQNYIEGSTSDKFGYGSKVGLGVLFANKNYNLWRIGIDYKYSFSAVATESYALNRGYANEQTGTTTVKGNYIALSVGYVYSFARSPYAMATHHLKVDTYTRVRKPKILSRDLDAIYTKNQIAITSEFNYMIPPEVSINQGATFNVKAFTKLGLSVDYLFNLNKSWGIKTGLCMSGYSYNADSWTNSGYSSYNFVQTYGIKAGAIYRKQISHSNLWYAGAGLSLKKYFACGARSYQTIDSTGEYFSEQIVKSNGIITGADFETGILLTAKNYNQWKFSVTYFQAFTPLIEQNYSFRNLPANDVSSGKITASGSYFGINVGYVFSFKRNKKFQ